MTTFTGFVLGGFGLMKRSKAEGRNNSIQNQFVNAQVSETASDLINFFQGYGYKLVQAGPLVTGYDFNGGLEFDDNLSLIGVNEFCIQPASRVEDVSEKSRPGTLPLFHIISLGSLDSSKPNQSVDLALKLLVGRIGLAPDRLKITGTEHVLDHLPLLQKYGIQQSQIRFVDLNEARMAGKGSGYFEPKGHPRSPSLQTYSIEYVLPDGQEIEIAEIGLNTDWGFGIGVERLTMARHDQALTWDQALKSFRTSVQSSADRQNLPLPAGYYKILELSQPA
ncbi:hypothetical protein [Synechococcus sp. BIOS-E4-1]|uniref:hypothetical protein n=1 Tax=Synechococcus sp. BIOS-E4-1 TaxID=1400864 RepID=UPI001644A88D|nr:hypothetical protein [Synechococcus sp. BIOS-E4-1]